LSSEQDKKKERRRRYNKEYVKKHREKINKTMREYVKRRYANDPEFRERKKQLQRENNQRRKLKKAVDDMLEKGRQIID